MRKVSINALAGAGLLVLALAVTAGGQQPTGSDQKSPPPKAETDKPATKSKLEELLAQALQNNADIRVAAAKVNEAEAELQRTRLQVMQKVVQAHHAVAVAEANVARWQAEYRRLNKEVKEGVVDPQVLIETEKQLAVAKGQLAAAEAELPFLLGKTPAERGMSRADTMNAFQEGRADLEMWAERRAWAEGMARRGYMTWAQAEAMWSKPAPGPMADKIRKALDRPITITAKDEPLSRVLNTLSKDTGLTIQVAVVGIRDLPVTGKLENIPLGAALQWLEDAVPDCRVVVRDYGLLLANRDSLPPRALLLNDFWKGGTEGATRVEGKNPPPENVEGVVNSVDSSSGLVTISIGSDAGLRKGHTLEVFRLPADPKQSKYLGTLRILEVSAKEAVGQLVGRATAPLQSGDRVASKILGQ
jgi:hypothetical protein